ncbi:AbrB/MazE/SpoVT family DNA-binding domain-containing protein [Alcaligenes aquatilis]|uniref:AbrB/MazE/SpoVT family DNA-binding domain-containing protein n=1 Tax=Alcaligenes aquatilis TaxID=323284 RepID=UPI000F689F56|nr:AbrB/MazE/SpoVT family DNA-binding domain-containing protein [Alcaligenes aquatilis]QXR34676.1 AbrB/MazE/SpoVT family DNA-binding domain-containing protein [Alcaligenes aquatilis]
MQVSLQRNGDQWFVVVPDEFVKQHELKEGNPVHLFAHSQQESAVDSDKAARKYSLEELLAEMPKEVPLVEGWDEMPSVGREF